MSKVLLALTLALTTIFGMSACEMTSSDNISSRAIHGSHTVEVRAGRVTCQTTLNVGGAWGTYVELVADDALYCNGRPMRKQTSFFNQVWYEATLPAEVNGAYRIEFKRKGELLTAEVTLPGEIREAKIDASSAAVIGQPLAISWERSGDARDHVAATLVLTRAAGGTEGNNSSSAIKDDGRRESGRVSFGAEETKIVDRGQDGRSARLVDGPYDGKVALTRVRDGQLSGAWTGTAKASQSVELTLKLAAPATR